VVSVIVTHASYRSFFLMLRVFVACYMLGGCNTFDSAELIILLHKLRDLWTYALKSVMSTVCKKVYLWSMYMY